MPFSWKRTALMGFATLTCSIAALAGEAKPKLTPAAKEGLLADVKVLDGYTATLFAAPPQVGYPTGLVCAPNGEVFVAIDENGSLGHDPNRGRIVRCIDADNDGKAEKVIEFAKIDSPRGLVHTGDKLFVLNPPELNVYRINPDGTASAPELLVKGMGGGRLHPRGADHTTNQIQIGIDGWIYIAAGDFGFFKAVDKSGKEVEFHGGGVARVRPDGTELEIVSWGQRNIYDVAISPLMDLFTRDNTNDGDGWDVHLSHVVPGANYGYPSHYKSFRDETIPEMVDYGGGSPCGSIFLDEPGFPSEIGYGFYTCEWGRSAVFRHPLEANGASFKAQQTPLVELSRPTDMEVDGQSRLFIASWKDGGFSYKNPNVGYVARLTHNDTKRDPFPNLSKASEAQLLQHLASNSHYRRLHTQQEILRRGIKPEFTEGLEKLVLADGPLAPRVAAIFTLKQLLGAKSTDALIRIAANASVKEFALRALADRKGEGKDVPTRLFVDALADANPRVRLQAVTGIQRLERRDAAESLIALLADGDSIVSHIAFRTLVTLNAGDECLKGLDKTPANATGVLRALKYLHDPKVIDGLVDRLGKAQDAALKQGILGTLCRLYYKEAPWDGSWWGTRPDSSGPYFKTAKWELTGKIESTLKTALASGDKDLLRFLAVEIQKNKIDIPEAMAVLMKMADQDAETRASVIALLSTRKELPADGLTLLEKIALSEKDGSTLRLKALSALQKANGQPAQDAATRVLVAFATGDKDLVRSREEYVRDGKRAQQVGYFAKLADSKVAGERELAYSVLVQIVANKQAKKEPKAAASKVIDQGWSKPGAVELLKAIGHARADGYAPNVKAKLNDASAEVASAAAYAAKQLKIDGASAASAKPLIGKLVPAQVVSAAMKEKGDAKVGSELFLKQRCVACHTVSPKETLKGPFLGDVATRYKRAELLESILTPNAKIAQGFVGYLFKMKDGKRVEGFVAKEGEEVEVRNSAGESVMLPAKEIENRKELKTSVMPTGLVDNLTVEELGHLLAYLESLKTSK